jgi:peroxiredoxin
VQLARWQDRFAALGVSVAAMTYDDPAILRAFHDANDLAYPLLHDPQATHVRAYGILNDAYAPGDEHYGIPFPGLIFVDATGRVRAKFAVPDYRERPALEDVHAALKALLAAPVVDQ